jgi:hypothetical protein
MTGIRLLPKAARRPPETRYTSPHLSDLAGGKVYVTCPVCGMTRRYDAYALLERAGNYALPDLLRVLAKAEGCNRVDNDWYDRCRLAYDIDQMYSGRPARRA